MKQISVIVCNNGLGHAKRVSYLIARLKKNSNYSFKIYADRARLNFMKDCIQFEANISKKIEWNELNADVENYEIVINEQYPESWYASDIVWSDNFLFPTAYHNNVIITGSFLWCEVSTNNSFVLREKSLMNESIRIIGSLYFATDTVKSLDFIGVGIYNYLNININNNKANGILLSCGKSKKAVALFKKEITKLQFTILHLNEDVNIYIEPDFYHYFKKIPHCYAADYSAKMYREIGSTVIRPGIGSVSDAICIKARIYAVIESDNAEIENNVNTIEHLGIGEKSNCYSDGLIQAINYRTKLAETHKYGNFNIEIDGIRSTTKELENFFNKY
jgi:hypothetical protein